MRMRTIVFIAQSIDGYIAGKDGELDWLNTIPNPTHDDMGFVQLMDEVDGIVMGRTTFKTVCGFDGDWPYTKHVYVLSRTLSEVPEELSNKVSLLSGRPNQIIEELSKKGVKSVYVDGGNVIQRFLQEDLISELRITTIPVLLGGGFSLFGELDAMLEFELVHSKVYLGQLVQTHYRRKV